MQDSLSYLGYRCQRYTLTLPKIPITNTKYSKAYLDHMLRWPVFTGEDRPVQGLNKVLLHSTSAKICAMPELYGSLHLALSTCCGGQTPKTVKSRKSVSAFKVMAGTLVGGRVTLRSTGPLHAFCYKWAFLAPSEDLRGPRCTSSIGTGFFVFELGRLDYKAFEPLPGLYVQFDHNS